MSQDSHPDQLYIAIDPGIVGTGYAVFQHGVCIECETVRPTKQGTVGARIVDLGRRLKAVFARLHDSVDTQDAPPIAAVRVEQFQGHTNRPFQLSLMKASAAQGACLVAADDWAPDVDEINKGNAAKSDAEWLARSANIQGKSEHARDAYHLGIIAGFDRINRRA